MSLRGAWRRFKSDLEQARRFESDVRAASDAGYAERFGRYGSDGERAAFHRDFRKRALDDLYARDAVFIADVREQTELLDDELKRLKHETDRITADWVESIRRSEKR